MTIRTSPLRALACDWTTCRTPTRTRPWQSLGATFWLTSGIGLFHAPIDTTLALYRPDGGHSCGSPTIRTGWPYLAAHEAVRDHAAPSEEDLFYHRTATPGISHWSVTHVPAWLKAIASQHARLQPSLLCG